MGKSKKGKQRLVGMDEPLEYTTSCPFCVIASAFPPILPSRFANEKANPDILDPPSHVVLSTPHVMAFFDIMPITRGHVLVCPRDHRVKMSDISTFQGSELGKWLPVVCRGVMKGIFGTEPSEADWNIAQNNGRAAAQVVPHVHFHIIPRPIGSDIPKTKAHANVVMSSRRLRDDLDDDETVATAQLIRIAIREEVARVKREEGVDLEAEIMKDQARNGNSNL